MQNRFYGNKCRREVCEEAKIFSCLDAVTQKFLLRLAAGLDSFEYSSRCFNPVFDLLGWGSRILGLVAEYETAAKPGRDIFLKKLPFFSTELPPRAYTLLLNRIIDRDTFDLLRDNKSRLSFEAFAEDLVGLVKRRFSGFSDGKFVHLAGFDQEFSRFLRLACCLNKIPTASVEEIRRIVDQEIDQFLACFKS